MILRYFKSILLATLVLLGAGVQAMEVKIQPVRTSFEFGINYGYPYFYHSYYPYCHYSPYYNCNCCPYGWWGFGIGL